MKIQRHFLLIISMNLLAGTIVAQGFTITGMVKGLAEKSRVYLVDGNNESDTVAQAPVKNAAFVLSGRLTEPTLLKLGFTNPQGAIPVFIGNEKVALTGEAAQFRSIRLSGSPTQDDFAAFQKIFNPYLQKLNSISQLANSPAGAGKGDSLSREYGYTVTKIQTEVDQFLETRKSSYVSPFVLIVSSQLSDNVFLLEKRFNALDPRVQNGALGQYLKEQIANGKIGAVGTEAIDFSQNDTAGKPVALSDYKGKYVLLDFWASWCGPCRQENPNVVAMYQKFRDKNFTVLGVSLDRSRDPWLKAIRDDHLAWAQVSDLKFWNNEVAIKYRISAIPQNFLIGPDGKILGKNLRGPELQARLCELLGCN